MSLPRKRSLSLAERFDSYSTAGVGVCLTALTACASVSTVRPDLDSVIEQGVWNPTQCTRERTLRVPLQPESRGVARAEQGALEERIATLVETVATIRRQQLIAQQTLAQQSLNAVESISKVPDHSPNAVETLLKLAERSTPHEQWNALLAQAADEISSARRSHERELALEAALVWHSNAAFRLCEARLNGWHRMDDDADYWRRVVADYDRSQLRVQELLTRHQATSIRERHE